MATWTPLKIELMTDGTEDTTWGQITNENWEALESAVAGSVAVAFSSADVTLSLSNTSAPQDARNLRLVCTGTSGGARNLNVPAVEKLYLITNNLADTVTVKTVAGTGIAVPAGKSAILYCNGVNVVNAVNYFASLEAVSPAFTGTPTSPTASPGTNTTQIATTAFVQAFAGTLGSLSTQNSNNVAITGGSVSTTTLTNNTYTNYTESTVDIGTVTTAHTINLTSGTVQIVRLTANTTCTFTMPTATAGKSFILFVRQAATTGNGNATFTGVKWSAFGTPTITATANRMDILTFVADGTSWYGSFTQGYTL
jgi:hypothetical protein